MSPFPTGKRCHPHVPTIGHHPTRRITPNMAPKYAFFAKYAEQSQSQKDREVRGSPAQTEMLQAQS